MNPSPTPVNSLTPNGLVEVAVTLPLFHTLTYRLPEKLATGIGIGVPVLVPVGRRQVTGYILGPARATPTVTIKDVNAILDSWPRFDAALVPFFRWLADYYQHPIGEVFRTALPTPRSGKNDGQEYWVTLNLTGADVQKPGRLGPKAKAILAFLKDIGSCPLAHLSRFIPRPRETLGRLARANLVILAPRARHFDPLAETPAAAPPPVLSPDQEEACQAIRLALRRQGFSPFLVYGVTASGKTEVYLQAAQEALALKKSVLVLLPEIALTHPIGQAFRQRFGPRVALLHSGLSDNARVDQWRRLALKEMDIAVGARSAVFAPLADLGLIVVDEEHDQSYKNEGGLPYQARDAALYRGQLAGAVTLLGSATPSVTTYYRAQRGKYQYISLPERVTPQSLPQVHLVNLREHREGRRLPIISAPLRLAIAETLSRKEQVLLFLNRRGYANVYFCLFCSHIFQCQHCSVSLTLHRQEGKLRCHYCGYQEPLPVVCPQCQSTALKHYGLGGEFLEREVRRLFPEARIARLDRDTASHRGKAIQILEEMKTHRLDILIGTQMITKGHDFPQVTLVGAVAADLSLYFPEYHAGERTFQLLTQVAGRAGRGDRPGQVFIQTYHPEHFALTAAQRHDYQAFYEAELAARRDLGYPPFTRLALLRLQGKNAATVEAAAHKVARAAQTILRTHNLEKHLRILGPAPAPRSRLKEQYRWQILLKSYGRQPLSALLDQLRASGGKGWGPDVTLLVDMDPAGMQ
ncbi:replication restart helicase PriA [Desulfobacca acetoxidans]|uniref:Replication restart protein PriA n=1 Tax=Desulfobacca acetoxidans (strain ATCC 700848 / DSM 11109 / ASRB2) TaxID=880072 RepID=F2NGC4_DESAR|nr:primosomal protein N' [Desulfobacca acetoxidans]AEB08537.1 primosomal protein N' [Desulfobacca acetoxidans DSM 11109]